jgi:hypothetical protein
MPEWSHDLGLQSFSGPFDYFDVEWTPVKDRGDLCFVAKVTQAGYDEFMRGEVSRGSVDIIQQECKGDKKNLLMDRVHSCCRGSHSHASQAAKAKAGPTLKSTDENAPKQRRSGIEMGQSIKVCCKYAFRAKCYTGDPNNVLLKFKPGQHEHKDAAGEQVHVNSVSSTAISVECREFVFQRLLLRSVPKVILEGEFLCCDSCMGPGSILDTNVVGNACVQVIMCSSSSNTMATLMATRAPAHGWARPLVCAHTGHGSTSPSCPPPFKFNGARLVGPRSGMLMFHGCWRSAN